MFKLQYRIYPEYICSSGDIRYTAQYRYFPFWWTDVEDYSHNDISAWNREKTLEKLEEFLILRDKLISAQKEARPL